MKGVILMKRQMVNRGSLFSLVAVLMMLFALQGATYGQTMVEFADANLARGVRSALGLDTDPKEVDFRLIPQQPLAELTELYLVEKKITDLTGLEHATQLTVLDLGGKPNSNKRNQIRDITPLARLTQLTVLDLNYNQISDIAPLARLTQLTRLRLRDNQISDIAPLAQLAQLTELTLSDNQISNIAPLARLTQLTRLRLWGNQISDIAPLAQLAQLTELALGDNQISNIAPLAQLTQLTGLSLSDNQISDIAHLAQLTQLTALTLSDNQISNIAPLAQLTQLRWLYLGDNQISDVSPLTALASLTNLNLENNPIADTSPVRMILRNNPEIDTSYIGFPVIVAEPDRGTNSHLSIYWVEVGESDAYTIGGGVSDARAIHHTNLVKTQYNFNLVTGKIVYITIDAAGGKLYWTEWGTESIRRANLDGTSVEDVIIGLDKPYSIALDAAGGKLYWTERGAESIRRANLDGTSVEDVIIGLDKPYSIALDAAGGKLYWTEWDTESIRRANLDGTNVEDVVIEFGGYLDIALDVAGGKLYWTNWGTDSIRRANLDGTYVEDVVGFAITTDIALDVAGGKLYWTDQFDDIIRRANLDGTSVEDVVVGVGHARDIALISSVESPLLKEDVNGDNVVNIADLVVVAANLGETGENDADVNGDGIVNVLDLVLVAGAMAGGVSAPSAQDFVATMSSVEDVQEWLAEARQLNLANPTAQRGIRYLERLSTALLPKETVLLANYPNPFNPETWIPYQLAVAAKVTLTIYDMNGVAVRRLEVGHRAAGLYQSRGRAAYWDGRNQQGETVASGIYFYTLNGGDFAATRKMLIRK